MHVLYAIASRWYAAWHWREPLWRPRAYLLAVVAVRTAQPILLLPTFGLRHVCTARFDATTVGAEPDEPKGSRPVPFGYRSSTPKYSAGLSVDYS